MDLLRFPRMQTLMPPPARPLDELVAGMPGRGRCLSEAGWVVAALLALGWVASALELLRWSQTARQVVLSACLVVVVLWVYGIVRPWRAWRAGRTWSAALTATALAPLALLSASGLLLREKPPSPRIGVQLGEAPDPASRDRRLALVQSVVAGTPADHELQDGDLILTVNGDPLSRSRPARDLRERSGDLRRLPPGATRFRVLRDGRERDVVLTLGEVAATSGLRKALRGTLLRDLALLGVLWLMLRADGQGLTAVGFDRRHLQRELRITLPAFSLLVASHLGVSIVVGLAALAFGGGSLQAEVGRRQVVAGMLVSEHLIRMVPLILVAGATEEIAFRGFMLPRLRLGLGGWIPALLAGATLFGAGHFYEGPLATIQTASMGLLLGLIFVWRRQLVACVLSHVAFNALALLMFWTMTRLGFLERAGELLKR
jgi:membrane protease YdiL (CAAX protease family)